MAKLGRKSEVDPAVAQRKRWLTEAEGYLELDMPTRAVSSLDRLGDRAGWESHAHYLHGEALRNLDRFEEAILSFEKAQRDLPELLELYVSLAWCHKRTGRLDLAIETLEEALEVDATEPLLYYNLACYWSLAGHKARVLRFLGKAFYLDGSYRDMVDEESDFDPMRGDPDFIELTSVIV